MSERGSVTVQSEPIGVVVHDADADRLIVLPPLIVEHEGRRRILRLRVARGVIQDAAGVGQTIPPGERA